MRRTSFLLTLLLAAVPFCASHPGQAQDPAAPPNGADPAIKQMVGRIDPDNLKRTIQTLVSFGTRSTLSTQDDPHRGIGAARDWIYDQFAQISNSSGGRLKVEKQTFLQPVTTTVPQPTQITNIIATLPGDLPPDQTRYLVVSGHYDSRNGDGKDGTRDAPGADDDGSAVASVLEIARVMVPLHFHATLVFECVAGEEEGLLGSKYAAGQDKANGWHIEGVLNNDIIGSSTGANGIHDSRSVRVFCEGVPPNPTPAQSSLIATTGGENDTPPRELGRFIWQAAKEYVPRMSVTLVYRRDRYLRGGDQSSFLDQGYPAVRFTEAHEDFHHQHQDVQIENGVQYGDLPQFLDYKYMANVARVNAASLAVMALAPDTPQNDEIVMRGMTADTTLTWKLSPDPNLAGYMVVWRPTDEPQWTGSKYVGNVTSYGFSSPSKDDDVFGICAVDRDGHVSPAAFPIPVRQEPNSAPAPMAQDNPPAQSK
jgi:hypothetical protein